MVISLAKQLDHRGQSNGLESADSEMQSPAYQNVEMLDPVAATSVAWLAGEHLPTSVTTTITITCRSLSLGCSDVVLQLPAFWPRPRHHHESCLQSGHVVYFALLCLV
jgi:hypothetical protein